MSKYIIAVAVLLVVGISAFFILNKAENKSVQVSTTNQTPKDISTSEANASFTMEEIAKHNNENDCWLLIDGGVYDVTNFVPEHPGEEKILEGCGKDATELFATKAGSGVPHSSKAVNLRNTFKIGVLMVTNETSPSPATQ